MSAALAVHGGTWPSGASTVVGVMGDPVAHSLSPLLHNTAFGALGLDWVSVAFRVPAGSVADALGGMRALGIRGLSVTMPHKASVARLVQRASDTARVLGAVNCVVVGSGAAAELFGDNTDGAGFVASLRHGARFDPAGRRAVVIGAGGAARAVVHALGVAGAAEVVVVARDRRRAGAAAALAGCGRTGVAEDAASADIVVEATPVGMAGTPWQAEASLVPPALLHGAQVAADLVYDPPVTPWLAAAAGRGATVLGGLGMLVHQAGAQVELWTGLQAPVAAMWSAACEAAGVDPRGGTSAR